MFNAPVPRYASARGPVEAVRPGDRVFFEPGEKHWHGAAPSRFMVHLAMQQHDESGSCAHRDGSRSGRDGRT
jgi:quercetin dioxygenase-like cupin family protein